MSTTRETSATGDSELLRPLVLCFLERAAADPQSVAFAVYPHAVSRRSVRHFTWGEWATQSRAVAGALLSAGHARGERVGILSSNKLLWPIADIGISMAGLIGVGLDHNASARQTLAVLADCGARTVIVDTLAHMERVLEARAHLPYDVTVVCEDLSPPLADPRPRVLAWNDWIAHGARTLDGDARFRDELRNRVQQVVLDDDAILAYTIAPSGEALGARVSHRMLAASAAAIARVLKLTPNDTGISVSPYCDVAERIYGMYTRIHVGMCAALVEQPADIFAVARQFEPTIFSSTASHYEQLSEEIDLAQRTGEDVRQRLIDRVGSACRIALCHGPLLNEKAARFLDVHGLPVLGSYMRAEQVCVAINRPGDARWSTVGVAFPGVNVRIAADGELQVERSDLTFSGYWRRENTSRLAFTEDGKWLRTGEVATIDPEARIRTGGNVVELITLSTGRKIAPQPIEQALGKTVLIAHAVCHGDDRPFLTAVIALRRAETESWARSRGVILPWEALAQHSIVKMEIAREVERVNLGRSPSDQLRSFALTEHEFTVEGGELAFDQTIVRAVIDARFKHVFDELYEQ